MSRLLDFAWFISNNFILGIRKNGIIYIIIKVCQCYIAIQITCNNFNFRVTRIKYKIKMIIFIFKILPENSYQQSGHRKLQVIVLGQMLLKLTVKGIAIYCNNEIYKLLLSIIFQNFIITMKLCNGFIKSYMILKC